MAYTRKMAGKVPVLKQDLVFDETPTPGSENAVTSGGVAEAVGAISDAIPEGASAENKLVTMADLKAVEEELLSTNPPAANTLRFEFSKMNYDPVVAGVGTGGTWKKLNTRFTNIWDWTNSSNNWNQVFNEKFKSANNLVKVINSNIGSATTLTQLFASCTSIKYVYFGGANNAINISSCFSYSGIEVVETQAGLAVTSLRYAFLGARELKYVPLVGTSSVTDASGAFSGCYKVEGGALALYTQMSTQTTPPNSHSACFYNCGKDTTAGAAELAQIPASWGGTGT